MEGIAMKRFAALALILCIGLFTIGCAEKKPTTKPKDKPAAEAGDEAKAGSDAKTDDAKTEEKKDKKPAA